MKEDSEKLAMILEELKRRDTEEDFEITLTDLMWYADEGNCGDPRAKRALDYSGGNKVEPPLTLAEMRAAAKFHEWIASLPKPNSEGEQS